VCANRPDGVPREQLLRKRIAVRARTMLPAWR